MADRIYSVEEANELLPHLAPTLVELREKFEDAARIRAAIARAAASNGGSLKREEEQRILARVSELIKRLEDWEIELRDITTGLIDFPTLVDGDRAFLCWRLGEQTVAYWHSPDDGFLGRRPLDDI